LSCAARDSPIQPRSKFTCAVPEPRDRYGITNGNCQIRADWKRLFEKYPERFLISDAWIDERWDSYGSIMADYRAWLRQLPAQVPKKSPFATASDCFADHGGALSAFAMAAAAEP
jgi:hypothetical protein